MLLLLTLTLPFNANPVSATTQTSENRTNQNSNLEKNIINNNQTETNKQTSDSTSKTTETSIILTTTGATEVYPKISFSYSQINTKATNVKNFIENNQRIPYYVTISTYQLTMPQFLQLLTENLLQLNSKTKKNITLLNVNSPSQSSESLISGNLYKKEYLSLAQQVVNTIKSTGSAPKNMDSNLGTISYENQIYIFSRLLNFYQSYGRLPNYVAVESWNRSTTRESTSNEGTTTNSTNSTIPSSLQQYLQPTNNCQSTNSVIVSLSNNLTAGKTTSIAKAVAIFNWVRDNITYSFYYNSAKGALDTLNAKTANCCDTSHLLIALMRAAGIPAKYMHGTCNFADGNFYGTYGHVWAQVYVDGKWYDADAVTCSNKFGVINNFKNYVLHGTYASLPF